jgi:hypothetical protein
LTLRSSTGEAAIVSVDQVDAASLLPLLDRVAAQSAPGRVHPAVWSIDESTEAWARQTGLISGDPDSSALGRARFGRLAARLLPDADQDRAELFGRWLIWLFAFDDLRDEGPMGRSATAVEAGFADLFKALRRGGPRPAADPLELGLTELWRETAPGMTQAWRHRFIARLEDHRAACAEEAVHRRTGHICSVDRYPALRRRTAGLFMFDLLEPALGRELPAELVRSPGWHALVQATADIITWSNDVISYPGERKAGHGSHNYLAVLAQAYGLEPEQTAVWVIDRITERLPEAAAAVRRLPTEYVRLGLADEPAEVAAQTLLAAPGAYLDWLHESGRYCLHEAPVRRESLLVRAGVTLPVQQRRPRRRSVPL